MNLLKARLMRTLALYVNLKNNTFRKTIRSMVDLCATWRTELHSDKLGRLDLQGVESLKWLQPCESR